MTVEKVEVLESRALLLNGQIEYAQRLIVALGDPSAWTYDGTCLEAGGEGATCACGHKHIRYCFPLAHPDGRSAIVGSTCIKHYALFDEGTAIRMAASYDSLMKRIAEAEAKNKYQLQLKDIQAGKDAYVELRLRVLAIYNAWYIGRFTCPKELRHWCVYSGTLTTDKARRDYCIGQADVVVQKYKSNVAKIKKLRERVLEFARMIAAY